MASGPETSAIYIAGGLVRQIWPQESLLDEIISEEPLLGSCAKETDWTNGIRHHPLGWGANQGIGRTYADAKQYKTTQREAEFQYTTREMYASLSLEGKLLRTYEYTKQEALLVDPVTRAGEATIDRMRRRFSTAIHGNGVGVLGVINSTSTVTTDTITLTNDNDLKNFEEGRPITVEATGLTGGTASTFVAFVKAVGMEGAPSVQIVDSSGASVTWANAFPDLTVATGFSIYGAGCYDNDYIIGLDGFLPTYNWPSTKPGTLLTCDRNQNPGWLAGRPMVGTNLSVYQRIKRAARICVDAGNKPDTYLLSTRNFEKFEFEMDNKLVYTKVPSAPVGKYQTGVEYNAAVIQGPRGPINVMASMWMPDNVERCGELDTVVMGSIGPLVHWDMGNGMGTLGTMRTEDATDMRELRAVSDPGFLVKKPGAWVRVAV
jgi:hypothetical protein